MKDFTLLNGNKIPSLAYGTWLIDNKIADNCVKLALEAGYRHIDTAQAYRNEEGVGKGIRESGIPREDIYLTTKVDASHKSYKTAKKSIDESLQRLGVDYIDLILIHCPQPWVLYRGPFKYYKANREVWRALEDAYNEGKVRAIGVSNFNNKDMQNILDHCKIKPMVNQVLCHIGNTPMDVIKFCQERDIIIEAYSPIAHGKALKNKSIIAMAEKYNASVPQLCIKYTLQLDTISIPKATSKAHIEDNMKLDFEISKEDMVELIKLNKFDYGEDSMWPVFKNSKM